MSHTLHTSTWHLMRMRRYMHSMFTVPSHARWGTGVLQLAVRKGQLPRDAPEAEGPEVLVQEDVASEAGGARLWPIS